LTGQEIYTPASAAPVTRQPATKESREMRFGNPACGESYFKQDPEFCLAEGQARIAMVECDQAYRVDH
jgi:hypothetical protein